MITPACNSDAGAATESLDVIGMSKVATTPIPNTAIKINNISGLRFTIFLSLIQCLTSARDAALFGALPLNSSKMQINVINSHFPSSLYQPKEKEKPPKPLVSPLVGEVGTNFGKTLVAQVVLFWVSGDFTYRLIQRAQPAIHFLVNLTIQFVV